MPTNSIPKPITNARLMRLLKRLGACSEAVEWVGTRDGETAWNENERGDHLLWVAARIGVDHRLIVRAAAACAETALQYVPAGEDRPRLAIEAARRWADDPTEENRQRARQAADAADAATYATYATYAAYAAAYAADAADDAADAADAAYAYAYAAAERRQETKSAALKRCAEIVREHIPYEVVLAAALETPS